MTERWSEVESTAAQIYKDRLGTKHLIAIPDPSPEHMDNKGPPVIKPKYCPWPPKVVCVVKHVEEETRPPLRSEVLW